MIFRLIVSALLLQLVLTDASTKTNPDFVQSVAQCDLPLLQRVERIFKHDYSFNLMGGNTWQQFPDMNIIINLPFAQYVKVKYNVCYRLITFGYMAIRLKVNGEVNDEYTAYAEDTGVPCLFRSGDIYLLAGEHQFKVEYRTNNPKENGQEDWNRNFFKVEYYRKSTEDSSL